MSVLLTGASRRRALSLVATSALLASVAACGAEGTSSPGEVRSPGDGGARAPSGDAGEEPRPAPSAMKEGWQKAFAAKSASVRCGQTLNEMTKGAAATLTIGATTLVVGYEQTGQNQDPVFARFDGGTQVYCEHHEREAPDGRAYGVTWDGGPLAYVVYSIVGGGSAFDAKAKGQWLEGYGDGGGSAAVTFLGEVETAGGTLVRGTFVIAKKSDGKTNTHRPADAPIVTAEGALEVLGDSAFQPMNPDKSLMQCTGYPFSTRYVFRRDMTSLVCASSTNCIGAMPCDR